MDNVILPFAKLTESVQNPAYAYEGDAGFDLRSNISCVIEPFERMCVPTGLSLAIPEGYAGLVIPRSGLAVKHGISVVNAPGLIDSGYRGEIKVILINMDKTEPFTIQVGDRIAQLMLVPFAHGQFQQCETLDETARGERGFGSSGKL